MEAVLPPYAPTGAIDLPWAAEAVCFPLRRLATIKLDLAWAALLGEMAGCALELAKLLLCVMAQCQGWLLQ